jgi:DNA (cytosine-5)-methyltransferase 1
VRVLDLFSGIGGFSLGLERAGMRTVAFCETNEYNRGVLRKHWPDVPCFGDVRDLRAEHVGAVDLICGGFPCQDISTRGLGAGLAGERSGLWFEFHRLIAEIRPSWVVAENVSVLRSRGLDIVLRGLAEIGYDAEWHCIPASAVGAPHRRDRVWVIAYPDSFSRRARTSQGGQGEADGAEAGHGTGDAAYASCVLRPAFFREQSHRALQRDWPQDWPSYIESLRSLDDGVSDELGELAGYGNAVVPAIPEIIGRAIMNIGASHNWNDHG